MGLMLVSIGAGVILGLVLRRLNCDRCLGYFSKILLPLVAFFLLLIGYSFGGNVEVMASLKHIAIKAGILACGGMIGSIVLASLVEKLVMRRLSNNGYVQPVDATPERRAKQSNISMLRALTTSALLLGCFCIGATLGRLQITPLDPAHVHQAVLQMLNFVFWVVGVGMGGDRRLHRLVRNMRPSLMLVPLLVATGTLAGTAVCSTLVNDVSPSQAMGVGAGLCYYSLASVMISNLATPMLGALALLVNLFRELLSIGCGPLIVRFFGPFGLIASGASSSCSVVLPMVSSFAGRDFVVVAVVSGLILELAAPLLIMAVFGMQRVALF